jgi:hypothetical protein
VQNTDSRGAKSGTTGVHPGAPEPSNKSSSRNKIQNKEEKRPTPPADGNRPTRYENPIIPSLPDVLCPLVG